MIEGRKPLTEVVARHRSTVNVIINDCKSLKKKKEEKLFKLYIILFNITYILFNILYILLLKLFIVY